MQGRSTLLVNGLNPVRILFYTKEVVESEGIKGRDVFNQITAATRIAVDHTLTYQGRNPVSTSTDRPNRIHTGKLRLQRSWRSFVQEV
jgi:hypothetical protein